MTNVPQEMIMKVQSKTFEQLVPGALFEWHQNSCKLYVIKPVEPPKVIRDGILIAEMVRTPIEVKQTISAYVQGFKHGRKAT